MMQNQFNFMKVEKHIIESFINDVEKNGLFWRINRQNTFIDLLMLDAHKAAKKGINTELATNIVITSLKAIINDLYGKLDYKLEYESIITHVSSEEKYILEYVEVIINKSMASENSLKNTLHDDLNYFTVLNNLKIDNYSVQVFENILSSFLFYIESKL